MATKAQSGQLCYALGLYESLGFTEFREGVIQFIDSLDNNDASRAISFYEDDNPADALDFLRSAAERSDDFDESIVPNYITK